MPRHAVPKEKAATGVRTSDSGMYRRSPTRTTKGVVYPFLGYHTPSKKARRKYDKLH